MEFASAPTSKGRARCADYSEAQIRERLHIIQPYINWMRTFSCTEGNELIPQIAAE